MTELGKLKKVDLREVWIDEAGSFTPWLAQEYNIKLLGDTIGIELEVEAQEKSVGPFSADILCKDTVNNNWVLIENQLERTDHTHLGQLMTYAAGLDAVTIIWIAQRFTEEHRAAMDWLNEITEEDINFFGLEIEIWQIGDSAMAPKFNIVSKPNEWSKTVKTTAAKAELPETKKLQLEFWTIFKQFMTDNESFIRCTKPLPQNWMNHSVGRGGFRLTSVASAWDSELNTYSGEIRVELCIDHKESKKFFFLLKEQKNQIEEKIGEPLVWYCAEGVKMCRIYVRKSIDITNRDLWSECHSWLKRHLETFHEVFSPIVKDLDIQKYAELNEQEGDEVDKAETI
jgi:hypothetical protein